MPPPTSLRGHDERQRLRWPMDHHDEYGRVAPRAESQHHVLVARARPERGRRHRRGRGTWWNFTTAGPPNAFAKIARPDGATNATLSLNLTWASSVGSVGVVGSQHRHTGAGRLRRRRRVDPAVFRPSTGGWYILKSSEFYTTSRSVSWGLSTDVPMQGDFDGDGRTVPRCFAP
jgi:hypothetical protein